MILFLSRLFFCLIILFPFSLVSLASEKSSDQILFLRLHIDKDKISLVESQISDGTFKEARSATDRGKLYYEIFSDNSDIIKSASMKNPLTKEFEYEDPDNTGRLLKKVVNLVETDFTLRLNKYPDIDRIEFYLLGEGTDLKSRKSSGKFLGAVKIDDSGEGE